MPKVYVYRRLGATYTGLVDPRPFQNTDVAPITWFAIYEPPGRASTATASLEPPESVALKLCAEHEHIGTYTWTAMIAGPTRYRCPICEPQSPSEHLTERSAVQPEAPCEGLADAWRYDEEINGCFVQTISLDEPRSHFPIRNVVPLYAAPSPLRKALDYVLAHRWEVPTHIVDECAAALTDTQRFKE